MARRLLPDNDAWPSEASRAANNATVAFMDLLAILEEDGPVDLKDFHYILTSAAGSFVAGLSVTRRLGDPDAPPNPIIRAYPSLLSSKYDDEDETLDGEYVATMINKENEEREREPVLLTNRVIRHPTDVPPALGIEGCLGPRLDPRDIGGLPILEED